MPKKKVLIVDDNVINRMILVRILSDIYEVLQAEDGEAALAILKKEHVRISGIVLDLVMPKMDGLEFLRNFSGREDYRNIPVLVATSDSQPDMEKKCLKLGAWDFISKPYDPTILKLRMENIIGRSQLSMLDQIRHATEHDVLTGLYNRSKFFEATRALLDDHPNIQFALIRFDIDRFRLFNSFFGEAEGDRLLKYIAECIVADTKRLPFCAYGRIESDVFCLCTEFDKDVMEKMVANVLHLLSTYNPSYYIEPSFGIYCIDDPKLSVESMYARATAAAKQCKDKHMSYMAYYDSSMTKTIMQEQTVMNEAQEALDSEQFAVYLQPKYDLKTGLPHGAEALSRWIHPEKGMISPGIFVPIFERNGFIDKLDFYMWEHTCRLLRKWLDDGLDPAPISVNISRANMYNPKLQDILIGLIEKYQISPSLLNLELTESAYMDNPDLMKKTVASLQSQGFLIMMDDFGSGYSSLNTLKDITVDMLKIDMKFLPTGENNARSERILASIIRMAGWLDLPVVVEGVETESQKSFLQNIGCGYVQGYYYARPMPAEEYEKLLKNAERETSKDFPEANGCRDLTNIIWSSDSQIESIFSSIEQPVGVYEYINHEISPLRVNQKFFELFGYGPESDDFSRRYHQCICADDLERVYQTVDRTVQNHGTAECDYYRLNQDGGGLWVRVRFRYVQTVAQGAILFAVFSDITREKQMEDELYRLNAFLQQEQPMQSKMLIVDDDESSRAILAGVFDGQYEILEAGDGREALRLLEGGHDKITIVLLDMMMPEMNGEEFLHRKNENPDLAGIPVIVISAEDSNDAELRMLELGVNDYVTKPFIPELVRRRVQNVLDYNSRFHRLLKEYHRFREPENHLPC